MSEQQVWRVVDATGAVHEVVVTHRPARSSPWGCDGWWRRNARDAVLASRFGCGLAVAEILAPGVPTRAEAVAAARREGAEAMRAACDDACARIAEKHRIMGTTHSGAMATWVDGIENGAKLCACFVRALPLPGDATPADEVTP